MICNAVFEGGGAKGIAHIGALKAIEKYQLKIDRVAGTSAGAMIATLIALGYSADKIYDPETGNGVLPPKISKIIFPRGISLLPAVIRILITLLVPLFAAILIVGIYPLLYLFSLFIFSCLMFIGVGRIKTPDKPLILKVTVSIFRAFFGAVIIALSCIILAPIVIVATFTMWNFGILSTKGVENWLVGVIERSPCYKRANITIPARDLTFKQLQKISKFHLTLITSDLGRKRLTVFDHENENTRDISVIDGVIASIAIPLIFKCKKILIGGQEYTFVDGGMLSNFPAWSYRKSLLFDDLKHTLGIQLSNNEVFKAEINNPISYFKNLTHTALWGASPIENISVKGLNVIKINTGKVKTLDFFMNDHKAQTLYQSSYDQTLSSLIENFSLFPGDSARYWLQEMSNSLHETYLDFIRQYIGDKVKVSKTRLRACLIACIDEQLQTSKIIYHYNMERDIDRHIEFDFLEGVAGVSLQEGFSIMLFPEDRSYRIPNGKNFDKNRINLLFIESNRRELVKSDLKIIMTIPIFSKAELIAHGILDAKVLDDNEYVQNIDFDKAKAMGLVPKAVLSIDFDDYFVYDLSGEVVRNVYTNSLNDSLLSIFSGLASVALSDFSASVAD